MMLCLDPVDHANDIKGTWTRERKLTGAQELPVTDKDRTVALSPVRVCLGESSTSSGNGMEFARFTI